MKQLFTRRRFIKLGAIAGGSAVLGLAGCSEDSVANGSADGSAEGTSSAESVETSASSSSSSVRSNEAEPQASTLNEEAQNEEVESVTSEDKSVNAGPAKELVLIFSRADENYNVGYVETGNTMVIAQFVQEKTGADMFELEPAQPYAADYQTCIDYALEEQERGGRPELKALPDLSAYETVYFGFPVWWGDIPMPVYTAIEALDWQGKTIAPFNTHEGSGNAGMFATLARVCEGSTVLEGLTIQGTVAQQQRDAAEARVDEWLAGLGL